MVRRFAVVENKSSPVGALIDIGVIHKDEEKRVARGDKARSLYASDYGQCQRKVWFQFFPEKFPMEQVEPRTLRIFQNGDSVHERLSDYMRRSGVLFVEEQEVPRDELDVHGRCDGIAMIMGRFCVVEFKSINAAEVSSAKSEHQGQLMWYMHMWEEFRKQLRAEVGLEETSVEFEDLDAVAEKQGREFSLVEKMLICSVGPVCGEIVYESKQTQEIFTFPYELDDALIAKVRGWFQQVAQAVKEEKVPDVRYSPSRYPCRWSTGGCPYWDVCWK